MSEKKHRRSESQSQQKGKGSVSNGLYQSLLTGLKVGLFTADASGKLLDANPAFVTLLGYKDLKSLLRLNLQDIFVDSGDWQQCQDRLVGEDQVHEGKYRIRRRDSSIRWIKSLIRSIRDEQDTVVRYEGAIEDVTQEVQFEKKLLRNSQELEARNAILGATFLTLDFDERLRFIRDRVVDFLDADFVTIHLIVDEQLVLRTWYGLSATFRAHLLAFPTDNPPKWLRNFRCVHSQLNGKDGMPRFIKNEGIQSWASLPLMLPQGEGRKEEWLGTIMAGSRRLEAIDDDDIQALRAMSTQLALAIEHAKIHRQAQERLARLQTLHDIDRAIMQSNNLREVLHVVVKRMPQELGADASAISLLDKDQQRPKVFAMRLYNGTLLDENAFELAESLLHWFVEKQEPVIIHDLTQDPRVQMHRDYIRNGPLISYLGVPLIVRDETIGILHIMTSKPKVFADENVAFFRTLAGQAAIAIENARLFQSLKQELEERKKAEDALRTSEKKYRTLFEDVPIGLYRTTPEGKILDANPALVQMLGFPDIESLKKVKVKDGYIKPEERQKWNKLLSEGYDVVDYETQWRHYDGEVIWVRDSVRAIRGESGKILYYEGAAQDITQRKRAEEALRVSEERFRKFVENDISGDFVSTPEGLIYCNPKFLEIFGFSDLHELHEYGIHRIYKNSSDREKLYSILQSRGKVKNYEMEVVDKNGNTIFVIGNAFADFDEQGNLRQVQGYLLDITDQKEKSRQIEAALREKETLLREIYHRTKNNMQVILSMLRIQGAHTTNQEVKRFFREMENRIQVMSLVHEQLYQARDLSMINLQNYVRQLVYLLMQSYQVSTDRIALRLELEPIKALIDTVMPLGLILNELMSNALKYAFPHNRKGTITIKCSRISDGSIELVFFDNGIGVPQGFDFRNQKTLGLKTIIALAEHQLQGEIDFSLQKGVCCRLLFTDDFYAPRV